MGLKRSDKAAGKNAKPNKKSRMVTPKKSASDTRRRSLPQLDWSHLAPWLKRSGWVVAVVLVVGAVSYGVPRWMDNYPIHRVQVMGDFKYVDRAKMEKRLKPYLQQNYFNVALARLKADAEDIPWVQSVRVSKVWPDRIKVRVQERVAIAVWNDQYLVSDKGELFAPDNIESHKSLPNLNGKQGQVQKVMQRYHEISRIVRPLDRSVAALELEPRLSWYCELDNGLELLVDRQHSLIKIQRFAKLYRQLSQAEPKMAKVDLRYRQGLAVTWADPSQADRNENI